MLGTLNLDGSSWSAMLEGNAFKMKFHITLTSRNVALNELSLISLSLKN